MFDEGEEGEEGEEGGTSAVGGVVGAGAGVEFGHWDDPSFGIEWSRSWSCCENVFVNVWIGFLIGMRLRVGVTRQCGWVCMAVWS